MKRPSAQSNVDKIREDFPILKRKVNGKPLVYLDSAATSQKPWQVIGAIKNYYENYNSNIHRGIHQMSEEATEAFEKSREKAAKFINARPEQIIFTKNTTESINMVAYCYGLKNMKPGNEILATVMEHHSNFLPWQMVSNKTGAKFRVAGMGDDGLLDMSQLGKMASKKTAIMAVTGVSNVLGTINPAKEIGKIAHDNGSLFLVDGAQSVPHLKTDVRAMGCDFLAFSSHKMLGPTGVGVLYVKNPDMLDPFIVGGGTIKEVYIDKPAVWNDAPWKFEGGTPDISGVIGLGAAIDYLQGIGMENVRRHEKGLLGHALEEMQRVVGLSIYGPLDTESRCGVVPFNFSWVHPHDVAAVLDSEGIAVRPGHACCKPLMERLGLQAVVRASFYLYNTKEEITSLIGGLEKVKKIFRV